MGVEIGYEFFELMLTNYQKSSKETNVEYIKGLSMADKHDIGTIGEKPITQEMLDNFQLHLKEIGNLMKLRLYRQSAAKYYMLCKI